MTENEKFALVLFKDYSMLELKAFRIAEEEKQKGKIGGATEPWEFRVIDQALEYHRIMTSIKLNNPPELLSKRVKKIKKDV